MPKKGEVEKKASKKAGDPPPAAVAAPGDGDERREIRSGERAIAIGEVWEEVIDEAMDYPLLWRTRSGLMNTWLCTSIMALIFAPYSILGAILGILGSGMHICRCCKPGRKFAGKNASQIIYIIALVVTACDLVVGMLAAAIGTMFLLMGCGARGGGQLSESMCDWRKMFACIILGSVGVLTLHFIASFMAFVSMRDCHKELIRCECDHEHRLDLERKKHHHRHGSSRRHHHRRRKERPHEAPSDNAAPLLPGDP